MKNIPEAIKERRATIRRLQAEVEILEKALTLLNGGSADDVRSVTSLLLSGGSKKRKKQHPRKGKFNPKSGVGHAVAVLREAGVPNHLDDIVELIKKRGLEVKKNSLGSNLAKLAKKGQIFFRASAPNTFGLLEWESTRQVAQG